MQALWDFTWHEFCDWYLEVKKHRFAEAAGWTSTGKQRLQFMKHAAFVAPVSAVCHGRIWQRLETARRRTQAGQPVSISLAIIQSPARGADDRQPGAFELLQSIVTAARELRADNKLDPKRVYPAALRWNEMNPDSRRGSRDCRRLTRLAVTESANALPGGGLLRSSPAFDLRIEAQAPATNGPSSAESRVRLEKGNAN